MTGYEIRIIDNQKGKGLFATKCFKEGETIFEEYPIVSCQFAWNEAFKYLACDLCMRPLETAEQNVRRLSVKPSLELPYPECCHTPLNTIVQCDTCNVKYCSQSCKENAFITYHQTLCRSSSDSGHPLAVLLEAWKQIHYPPESTNIMLLVRILAMINQSSDPKSISNKFKQFCHRTVNDDAQLAHKLLGDKFIGQIGMLRELTSKAISGEFIQEFLTPEGFCSLLALIGTNGQGIGTSPVAQWVNNTADLPLDDPERKKLDELIDKIYEYMEAESDTFLNSEGSGLYQLQSTCNHSCEPNAEPSFPHGNYCLQLKALSDINPGDEIFISYVDECMLGRSRHSRQKHCFLDPYSQYRPCTLPSKGVYLIIRLPPNQHNSRDDDTTYAILRYSENKVHTFGKELAANYLFTCSCEKCVREAGDPDETSVEEMSEDEPDVEDMSD